MGERKGTNKYYPPDFDPKIHRNLNAYHGVHALRERGRKANEGVIIIRFEMPFNCWCLSCKKPIGMGVRYNAQKTQVGMYHSTPILRFTMNCAMCAGALVMQTDPQNFDYICVEGIRRKCQTWDPEENEQIVVLDYKEKQKFALDAMYQVEHGVKDKAKAATLNPAVAELVTNRVIFKDDFTLNSLARKRFRESKKVAVEAEHKDKVLQNRLSLTDSQVTLLPDSEEDAKNAKLIRISHSNWKGHRKDKKTIISTIFQDKLKTGTKQHRINRSSSPVASNSSCKHETSNAFNSTKQQLEQNLLARRAKAFSTRGNANKEPLHHTSLSEALRLGKLRRSLQTNNSTTPITNDCQTSSALVGYEDSD